MAQIVSFCVVGNITMRRVKENKRERERERERKKERERRDNRREIHIGTMRTSSQGKLNFE
jgi:hypothetical protein